MQSVKSEVEGVLAARRFCGGVVQEGNGVGYLEVEEHRAGFSVGSSVIDAPVAGIILGSSAGMLTYAAGQLGRRLRHYLNANEFAQ